MRDERANASFGNRILKVEFDLAVFFGNRVVLLNGDRAQWLAAFGDVVSQGNVVAEVSEDEDRYSGESDAEFHRPAVLASFRKSGR